MGKECYWKENFDSVELEKKTDSGKTGIEGQVYDLLARDQWYTKHSRTTNLHENLHLLQHYSIKLPRNKRKLIYCCGTHGFIVDEPPITTKPVADRVPKHIASQIGRWSNYVAKRPNDPLAENLLDEWNAYLTGAIGDIEWGLVSECEWDIDSTIDFFVLVSYSLALLDKESAEYKPYITAVAMLTNKTAKAWRDAKKLIGKETRSTKLLRDFFADEKVISEMKIVYGSDSIDQLKEFYNETPQK